MIDFSLNNVYVPKFRRAREVFRGTLRPTFIESSSRLFHSPSQSIEIRSSESMEILRWSEGGDIKERKQHRKEDADNAHHEGGEEAPSLFSPSSTQASLLRSGIPHAEDLRMHLHQSLSLLRSILKLFRLDEIALTFNGGKDACVVFHLARVAIAASLLDEGNGRIKKPTSEREREEDDDGADDADEEEVRITQAFRKIKILYFEPSYGEFPEITSFMSDITARYGIQYTIYQSSYKEGMKDMVDNHGLKAVLMGVRKGDPYTVESEHLQPSSEGWPCFLRVNPILKWDYGHIWRFLRGFELPYCCLYSQGYTSIGDIRTTIRNPALLKPGLPTLEEDEDTSVADDGTVGRNSQCYLPAYALKDYTLERANRRVPGKGHVRKASFRQMLPVALLCIGDFLSCRDTGPTALAHELREIRCRVVPMIVIFPEEDLINQYIKSLPTSLSSTSPVPLIILCIDEDAEEMARQVILTTRQEQQQLHHEEEAAGKEDRKQEMKKKEEEGGESGRSNHSSAAPSVNGNGGSSIREKKEDMWKTVTPNIERFKHTFLLSSGFAHLVLSEQKQQLETLVEHLQQQQKNRSALRSSSSSPASFSSISSSSSGPVHQHR